MNLHEHFLGKDLVQASKEYKRLKDCLKIATESIDQGEIEKAKHYSIDVLSSLHELTKLSKDKARVDRLSRLIPGMPTAIHIDIVRALQNE